MRKFIALIIMATLAMANQNFVILVEGMHCPLCTAMVRKALLQVDGVKSAKANLRDKKATVETDDKVSEQQLLDAVATTGYTGKILK
ncbi:heavy-metal-associated domain-containing protein [Campylobacter sp. RM16192]|uniref:heavy-metal-associated domain-containing protein n=1 Tax=Campylobacter sp. RM16192 TaxID=1660080 RepID=UPI0014511141|nr:heavy metal-associated domain-containing protein [Campylobacter sp. RM16192]QCD52880.1 heavy-metal-associated domain protein, putative mercuric reductase [Campylobacter sp. RM16192]